MLIYPELHFDPSADHTAQRIATHEAGHAVISHKLGLNIEQIRVTPPDGGCRYARGSLRRLSAFDQAVVLAAGVVAETVCLGASSDVGWRRDEMMIHLLSLPEDVLPEVFKTCTGLVRGSRDVIECIAEYAAKMQYVSEIDFRELIGV